MQNVFQEEKWQADQVYSITFSFGVLVPALFLAVSAVRSLQVKFCRFYFFSPLKFAPYFLPNSNFFSNTLISENL